MSQRKLTTNEIHFLQESLNSDCRIGNIRLREGEYQYDLAKAIASFQLELSFPDVKEITKKLYGAEKANDIQFIRKVQTILKKMEKSNIVWILPKKKPWDLQKYALLSFKFQDADKNLVNFATEQEIKQAQNLLQTASGQQEKFNAGVFTIKVKACLFASAATVSYSTILWSLMQPLINPLIFVLAFPVAVVCSVALGTILSKK